jgi:predicted Fe-Mo cluster-binding NifX family protein
MKIVVTSTGSDLSAAVDPRFGRAQHFILFDSETGAFQAADNAQNLNAVQGAGIQAAQNAVELGAEVVLTGHCGPKAFRTLQAAGVQVVVNAAGTVAEALEKFKTGELKASVQADVEGHWV